MLRPDLCAWACIVAVLLLFLAALTGQWPLLIGSAVAALGFGALALKETD